MPDDPIPSAGGPPADGAAVLPPPVDPAPAAPHRLAVEFTGSGGEYFRIWIVNLLLTLVTLTLYHPFAKARKLAYFQAHTRVGGDALGFHGDPRRMLLGHLLVLAFGVAYAASIWREPMLERAVIGGFVLVAPALWHASLRFRLGHTSWRGLRFSFDGGVGGAYRAVLPAAVPWVTMAGLSVLMHAPAAVAHVTWVVQYLLVVLTALLTVPLSLAWIKRYQHGHCTYAGRRCHLEATTGAFYYLCCEAVGLAVLLWWATIQAVARAMAAGMEIKDAPAAGIFIAVVASTLAYAVVLTIVPSYARLRLQNLVWGTTRSDALQFHSTLRLWPLWALAAKNLLLTVVTLGMYWPFAAVASARMRLQAVSVDVQGDLSQWIATSDPGSSTNPGFS